MRYRAVDSSGNLSRGATTNTTLNQASAAGATAVRLTSTTGRGAGDSLLIDTGAGQETATIATIVTPAPASPAPNVTLTAPLANAHAAAAAVAGTALYNTITSLIDTKGPVAIWGTSPTTLQPNSATAGAPAAAAGDTQIRLASLTGRAAGDTLQLDRGANAETVKIASIVSPAPAAPAPNVVLDERADEEPPERRAGVRAAGRRRQDPPVADPDADFGRSAPERPDRHRRQRRRRLGARGG